MPPIHSFLNTTTHRSFAIFPKHVYNLHENFSTRPDRGAPLTPAVAMSVSPSVATPKIIPGVLGVRARRLAIFKDLAQCDEVFRITLQGER